MLNRKTIAEMLGVSPKLLRESIEARPDYPRPALRHSRKTVRWDEADIRRWMQQQRQRASRGVRPVQPKPTTA